LHTEFARIETLYQREILLQDPFLKWGIPDLTLPPENILPDPYSRSGGLSRELMQIRRWYTKTPPLKKFRIFGRRRFNRHLNKHPTPPLSGSALESVFQNAWSSPRPQWFHLRRGTTVEETTVLPFDYLGSSL